MNVIDLFSGIGGFSLGLERAGMRTVAFCEINRFCQSVLTLRWPGISVATDIRDFRGERANVLTGGFPCQDISLAGKGAGLNGVRSGLWREYRRLIADGRPEFAIIENSSGLTSRGLGRILLELADVGYDAEWSVLSACALGFSQVRKRMCIVAYPQGGWSEQRGRLEFSQSSYSPRDLHHRFNQPEPPRVADGIPGRMDRLRSLGNSVVPEKAELIGRAIMSI
jgi:DNA (cytosine-5)-methyltransferase 1